MINAGFEAVEHRHIIEYLLLGHDEICLAFVTARGAARSTDGPGQPLLEKGACKESLLHVSRSIADPFGPAVQI